MNFMGVARAKDYDGVKAYIGEDRFNVVELDGEVYLVSDRAFNVGEFETYRVVRTSERDPDCADVVRVEDESILVALFEKGEDDLRAEDEGLDFEDDDF